MVTLSVMALGIGGIAVLVSLSAFFSSSESAIFTLPDEWVDQQDATRDSRVATLQELRSDPHRLLVTILVGNNVVNMAIASITTALLVDVLPTGSAVTIATVVASFIVLVFGEIVPKSYGLGHAREWCLQVARPISIVERVLYPLVALFDFITRRINAVLNGDTAIEKPYLEE
jgi:Mg2+/Co2+ transporter CorB